MAVLLLVGGLLMAVAACALASRLLGELSLFGRGPTVVAPVRINSLPTPVATRLQWTSYTHTAPVNDLALSNGLVWAATAVSYTHLDVYKRQPHRPCRAVPTSTSA